MRGFLIAPLPVWGLVAVLGFFDDMAAQKWTALEALGHELFLFPYYVIGSYFISFLIALPLYFLGWRHFRVSLVACLFYGATIGGGPSWVFTVLQVFGFWPKWDDENLGGVPLIVSGRFTTAGLIHYFMGGALFALFGMAIAFVFWLFAIRNNPAAQGKQFAPT